MRFAVLGPLEVVAGDGRAVRVPELKVRTLLACLLAGDGQAVPAERLIDNLWGAEPPGNPLGALRAKVSQLRRALDDAEPGARELLATRPPGYLIDGDTDARRFRDACRRAQATDDPRERAALLSEALAWWRGPAFAGFPDEPLARWAADRLEEQRLTALEDYADVRLALGQDASQVAELTELAARHPTRERFHALLMRALYRSGRQAEALEVHRALRERMRDELGLDPGPELAALHRAILEQSPDLRRPPVPPAPARLPEPLTELVGRDDLLAGLVPLAGGTRLLTLTGTAGVGKSTLALAAARELSGDSPVYLVELSSAGSGPDVAETITTALGLHGEAPAPGPSADDQVGAGTPGVARNGQMGAGTPGAIRNGGVGAGASDAIRNGGVGAGASDATRNGGVGEEASDATRNGGVGEEASGATRNGVGAGASDMAGNGQAGTTTSGVTGDGQVGAGASGVAGSGGEVLGRIAAAFGTRRGLLVLDNCEHVVEAVAELVERVLRGCPGLRVLATSREPLGVAGEVVREVPPLDTGSAMRLFAARAADAQPGFALTGGDADAAEVICRRLDGIPLALELAAARVRSLGVRALADRLDDRFRLLSAGRRGGPAHQRTLRAALDWSWELLTEPERVVLRRLAVHVGGCTLEAAEQVCAVPSGPPVAGYAAKPTTRTDLAGEPATGPDLKGDAAAWPGVLGKSETGANDPRGGTTDNPEIEAEKPETGAEVPAVRAEKPETGAENPGAGAELGAGEVADLLARLVDRSLVVRSGERYRLLESVAAYGMERLREAGEHDRVLRWYATYYTQLAECAETYRSGPARHRWIRRLDAEAANLRAALEAATSLGDARLTARFTGSLGWYWLQAGRLTEPPARRSPTPAGLA